MLAQFLPLYCVLVVGAFGSGFAAIQLALKLQAGAATVRTQPPSPPQAEA